MSLEKHSNLFPLRLFAKGQFWVVSNMDITHHILNDWPCVASLIRSWSWNTGRHRTRFSDNTSWCASLLFLHTVSYGSELSMTVRNWKGKTYSTVFTRTNNALLNDITENELTTCFSMKCEFISPKCTLVSMAVQVKQNITSDVITLSNTRVLFWTFSLGWHMAAGFSFWCAETLRALNSLHHVFPFGCFRVQRCNLRRGIKGPMVPGISFVYP